MKQYVRRENYKFTYFFSISTSSSVVPHEKVPLLMTTASTVTTKHKYIQRN